MGLRKFLKKAVKLGGKVAKIALEQTPGGRVALQAQQKLKSLGSNLKAARLGKIEPLSVRAPIEKTLAMGSAFTGMREGRRQITSMPVEIFRGAARARTSGNGSRMPQKRRSTATATQKVKKPLSPSKLKAQAKSRAKYAAWKAAGKPGAFFDWARANR